MHIDLLKVAFVAAASYPTYVAVMAWERLVKRERARRADLRARGLCTICGETRVDDGGSCGDCWANEAAAP